jgi:hypothetical protein
VSLESCIVRSNSISGATTGGGGIQTAGGTTLLNTVVAQNSPNGLQITGNNNFIQDSTFTANQGYGAAFLLSTRQHDHELRLLERPRAGDVLRRLVRGERHYCTSRAARRSLAPATSMRTRFFLAPPADLRPGASSPVVDAGNNNKRAGRDDARHPRPAPLLPTTPTCPTPASATCRRESWTWARTSASRSR